MLIINSLPKAVINFSEDKTFLSIMPEVDSIILLIILG